MTTTIPAAAAIPYKRTFKTQFSPTSELNHSRSISFLQLSSSKSIFFGRFGSKVALSRKNMTELVQTSGFTRSDDEESVGMLQQEAVVDRTTVFSANGLEATLNRLSKWLVAGLFGAAILWRHDAEVMWVAMGSIVNAILSITLKRILNQERPFSSSKSDPGMPSSHAQSIFFIFLFAIMSVLEWYGVNEFTVLVSAITLAFGSYLTWLRVSQRLHTINQVAVGAAVGSIFSIAWYWSWNAVVLQAFESFPWVRMVVVVAAAAFCIGFLVYVIRYWLSDE